MGDESAGRTCPSCGSVGADFYAGDRICSECRRERRRKSYRANAEDEKRRARIYRRALTLLSQRHPAEFVALVRDLESGNNVDSTG